MASIDDYQRTPGRRRNKDTPRTCRTSLHALVGNKAPGLYGWLATRRS